MMEHVCILLPEEILIGEAHYSSRLSDWSETVWEADLWTMTTHVDSALSEKTTYHKWSTTDASKDASFEPDTDEGCRSMSAEERYECRAENVWNSWSGNGRNGKGSGKEAWLRNAFRRR